MQIDFHHAVTYVVSRLAGLDHEKASVVAYSAQYVDDATNSGVVHFTNSPNLYERISSAHKTLDYRNWDELANHRVWIPFHFLPANAGRRDESPKGVDMLERLVCRPNSVVAQSMLEGCIRARNAPSALHRLGITMHVYADTWAHQGFVGMKHDQNHASDVYDAAGKLDVAFLSAREAYYTPTPVLSQKAHQAWLAVLAKIKGSAISSVLPLGHGAVLTNPDKPFLTWSYLNGLGDTIKRNNPDDFIDAAVHLYRAVKRFVAGDPAAAAGDIGTKDKLLLDQMLRTITDEEGDTRHARWVSAIADGVFSFGPQQITYVPKGLGAWKYDALGTVASVDGENEEFPYRDDFVRSNWKLFHDALQMHRLSVLTEVLPHYGLCVA